MWPNNEISGVILPICCSEMMAKIEAGKVSAIIVKDYTRRGRNRRVMGYLLKDKFLTHGIYYIAINDDVDPIRE